MSIYKEHGFANRNEYLENLAYENGYPLNTVLMLALLYGPDEDFDGLITSLEDAMDAGDFE